MMMNTNRYPPTTIMKAMVMATVIVLLSATGESLEPAITRKGCQDDCGGVPIPYPFGIGFNCSMEGFEVECNTTNHPPKLISNGVAVRNISLSLGQARVTNPISSQHYNLNGTVETTYPYMSAIDGSPFRINSEKNKFTVIGCGTSAYNLFTNTDGQLTMAWCAVTICAGDDIENISTKGSCSRGGCCQAAVPKGTSSYAVKFGDDTNYPRVHNFSLWGYAALMEDVEFVFSSEYIATGQLHGQQMPLILDWAIGDEPCDVAQRDISTFACISNNSVCVDSTNGPGYLCSCSTGYDGNPYLEGGCQDIDECANKNQCSNKCYNLPGTFKCSCPAFMRLRTDGHCQLYVPLAIGTGFGILLLVFLVFCMFVLLFERRKISKIKEKYFQQHGGWILLEEIKSNTGFSFTIFSKQEVEQATNNFDNANIIGQGGQGTVYKGIVKGQLVAIKKCKIIDENKKKEFGKEMIILSQISHKNIVKLIGCCLEVEVPMLVYEFMSNGTLFNHIHDQNLECSITLQDRLRIAHESAEALAYLHYSASPPIFHGDIKTANILLDECFIAKVSDFGASILAPTDEYQYVTLVQGTCGYLDPEYLQSCHLTDKSDVYSFGVVLMELLTGKPVIDFDVAVKEKSLSSLFLSAMKDDKVYELVDVKIKWDEDTETIRRICLLAKECVNVKGEYRPTMKQVAEELQRIRELKKPPSVEANYDHTTFFTDESSSYVDIESNNNFNHA